MRTYDGFTVVFKEGLYELKLYDLDSTKYYEKAQELGWYCYEAEEHLPTKELHMLKGALGISEQKWRTYKAVFTDANFSGE